MAKLAKLTKLWEGLTAVFAVLLCVLLIGTTVANAWEGNINEALGITTSEFINDEVDPNADLEYYKTSFGDGKFSKANLEAMSAFVKEQAINEMREGAALLYNPTGALPLGTGKKVSTFGVAAKNPVRRDGGSSSSVNENGPNVISLKDALTDEGFSVNSTIWDALPTKTLNVAKDGNSGGNQEENKAFYEARIGEVGEYTDAAIVVIGRKGSEGSDLSMDQQDTVGGDVQSSLALLQNEIDMLSTIKNSGKFGKIILLLNTGGYAIETYQAEQYVDAILMIGNQGHYGLVGVAEILSGKTNPSGKLVDTYAKNSLSAPAVVNSGTRTPYFTNSEYVDSQTKVLNGVGDYKSTQSEQATRLSFQAENIYIGYRYYETRYADVVTGDGNKNASGAKGASFGASSWKYEDEVSYTFGYGLSYTTFEQKIDSISTSGDNVTLTVTVKNTGSVAGKSAVQVYAQTPYGDYEKQHKVEKAGIQLVGYGKTKLLNAGASDTVTVTIDKYLLASYDSDGVKGYYLSQGDYYFAIGNDAHDALNNVLAARGYTTADGMVASTKNDNNANGNANLAKKWTLGSRDERSYRYSVTANGSRGTRVTNQFEDIDLNYWINNGGTYLSRSDWQGTYPTQQTTVAATDAMIKRLAGNYYETPDDAPSFAEIAKNFGKDQGITLSAMIGVPISETEAWKNYVYQLDIDELYKIATESMSGYAAVSNLKALPVGDGTNGGHGSNIVIDANGNRITLGRNETAPEGSYTHTVTQYPSKNILTGTFNDDLYAGRGRAMGEESLWAGKLISWDIGVDLHRTPFGGRNSEYMSECPTISYLAAIPETIAKQECGTLAGPKHFVGNDQETIRDGVVTFSTEQAFREGNLRAGEGTVRVANAGGMMQSFGRIGLDFASHCKAMNYYVLRQEWGWDGIIITDACPQQNGVTADMSADQILGTYLSGYRRHQLEMLDSSVGGICFGNAQAAFLWAKATDDGHILECFIDSAMRLYYGATRTVCVNGISGKGHMEYYTPWWQTALLASSIVVGVLMGAGAVLLVVSKLKGKGE